MTTRERLTLSAYEKFVLHGRFPWKFCTHVLLLLFSTAQILLWNFEDGGYYRATNRNWQYWFLYHPSYYSSCDLYTYNEVVESINVTMNNFYNIDTLSVDSYRTHNGDFGPTTSTISTSIPQSPTSTSTPTSTSITTSPGSTLKNSKPGTLLYYPTLDYTYYTDPKSLFDYKVRTPSLETSTERYYVNTSYFGPFDVNTLKYNGVVANINKLQYATLTLHLDSFIFGTVYRSCLEWVVEIQWDFRDRGQVTQKVDSYVSGSCNDETIVDALGYDLLWINIPISVLSLLYFVLSVKAVVRSVQTFMSIKRRHRMLQERTDSFRSKRWKGPDIEWSALSCNDKCQFFSVWFVLTMLSTACLFIVAVSNMIQVKAHSPTEDSVKLLSGSGCALIWFSLLRYFEHNKGFYILVATLKRGVPRVARFMVGVMPMMLGYAFFGMVCFGSYSDRFESFSASMITLFAVLNGDVIRETFLNLADKSPYVSQIYMYTFICLFIYVVLNVFIAIIEEAFFSAWEQDKTKENESSTSNETKASTSIQQNCGHDHGHDHVHGHGHGAAVNENRRTSQAQKFSQERAGRKSFDNWDQHVDEGESKTNGSKGNNGNNGKHHTRQITPSKPIVQSPPMESYPSEKPMAQSWNRFREILHNIESEELEQRHALLHAEDQMFHEELDRRRLSRSGTNE